MVILLDFVMVIVMVIVMVFLMVILMVKFVVIAMVLVMVNVVVIIMVIVLVMVLVIALVIIMLIVVRHMGHAHMGNSFRSGFFVDLSSNKSLLLGITVRLEKKSPQSALIGPPSLIMHDNWKI